MEINKALLDHVEFSKKFYRCVRSVLITVYSNKGKKEWDFKFLTLDSGLDIDKYYDPVSSVYLGIPCFVVNSPLTPYGHSKFQQYYCPFDGLY